MRTGQLARVVGVSPDTVRHYERLGLLAAPPRLSSGYRDYPPQAVERARLIRRALSAGFSLPELKTILRIRDRGGVPCLEVRAMAKAKLQQVKEQMKDLLIMQWQLKRIIKDWDARLARSRKGQRAQLLEHLPHDLVRSIRPTRFAARETQGGKKVPHANHNGSDISRSCRNNPRPAERHETRPR